MAGAKKAGTQRAAVSRKRPRDEATAAATGAPPAVTDERFSALHWDPRFSRVPKRATKLAVDERFRNSLKHGKGFQGSAAPVDRFGRAKILPDKDKALERLYDIESSSDDGNSDDEDHTEEDVIVAEKAKVAKAAAVHDAAKKAATASDHSCSEDDNVESADDEEQSEDNEPPEVIPRGDATHRLAVIGLDWSNARAVDIFASLQSFCPPGKLLAEVKVVPSKFGMERLAVEAKFGPQVLSGMDADVVHDVVGASVNKTVDAKASESEGVNAGEGESGSGSEGERDSESGESESDSDCESESVGDNVVETAMDRDARKQEEQNQMRKYEQERLKYFYAIADFDDAKTAEAVYEQCDGVEFESTGLAMDLRFIPDDMVIDAPMRDVATCVPDGYAPPNLAPSTLNNCKVKLSWDADAPDRAILKKKAFGKREEDEENLKAYLASSSESEGEGSAHGTGRRGGNIEDSKEDIGKKRMLLLGGVDNDPAADEDMEMEVSFEPGLLEKGEEIVKRKEERDNLKDETAWEARLRRMQERKTEKKKSRKEEFATKRSGDRGENCDDGDDDMYAKRGVNNPRLESDPFFKTALSDDEKDGEKNKQSARAQKQQERKRGDSRKIKPKLGGTVAAADEGDDDATIAADAARRDAELELVMMDDDRKRTGTSLRDRLAAADSDDEERSGRGKGNAGRTRGRRRRDKDAIATSASGALGETNAMDVTDDRFSSLFSSHMFAMDPTHPKFKRNETTEKILAEKTRRGGSSAASAAAAGEKNEVAAGIGIIVDVDHGKDGGGIGDDVMSLAASIKAKSKVAASQRKMKVSGKHAEK
jgi:NUC153 domain